MQHPHASFSFDPLTGVLHVAVSGEVDVATAPVLHGELLERVRSDSPAHVRLVLDEVTFFGADGLRLLHDLRRHAVVTATCRPGRPARRVLDLFASELAFGVVDGG